MSEPNRIHKAIDEINPKEETKQRMLENIRRKAAAQSVPEKKPLPLIKWAAPIAACLVVAVAAVIGTKALPSHEEPSDDLGYVQSGSPFLSVDSAADIAEQLGITLDAPEGAFDVQYAIIDNEIADVSFVYNGVSYTLRASEQGGDFSGIYGTETTAEQIDSKNSAVLTTIRSDKIYLKLKWTDGKISYILCCSGDDDNGIKEIYELLK